MHVAGNTSDRLDGAVVEIEPEAELSTEGFRDFVDRLLTGPEPELETIGAADVLQDLRADTRQPQRPS